MVASFLLMPHRQNGDGFTIEAITCHIAAVTKINQPFPELFWNVLNGTAYTGLIPKNFHPLPHGFDGARGRSDVFYGKEAMKALHIKQRLS